MPYLFVFADPMSCFIGYIFRIRFGVEPTKSEFRGEVYTYSIQEALSENDWCVFHRTYSVMRVGVDGRLGRHVSAGWGLLES